LHYCPPEEGAPQAFFSTLWKIPGEELRSFCCLPLVFSRVPSPQIPPYIPFRIPFPCVYLIFYFISSSHVVVGPSPPSSGREMAFFLLLLCDTPPFFSQGWAVPLFGWSFVSITRRFFLTPPRGTEGPSFEFLDYGRGTSFFPFLLQVHVLLERGPFCRFLKRVRPLFFFFESTESAGFSPSAAPVAFLSSLALTVLFFPF